MTHQTRWLTAAWAFAIASVLQVPSVSLADALSLGMTWNTFAQVIDGTGLERASYLDTSAASQQIRFYRVREHQ